MRLLQFFWEKGGILLPKISKNRIKTDKDIKNKNGDVFLRHSVEGIKNYHMCSVSLETPACRGGEINGIPQMQFSCKSTISRQLTKNLLLTYYTRFISVRR